MASTLRFARRSGLELNVGVEMDAISFDTWAVSLATDAANKYGEAKSAFLKARFAPVSRYTCRDKVSPSSFSRRGRLLVGDLLQNFAWLGLQRQRLPAA